MTIRTIDVRLGRRSYQVLAGQNLLARPGEWIELLPGTDLVVVSNEIVAGLYFEALAAALGNRMRGSVILPDGESEKTLDNWQGVLEYLADTGLGRDACLVALGGGVIGDLCGFAAASYMRGIRFVQVPTTLLAQVDSSVGGKTGVNLPRGKNLVGAFHQPALVVADITTLKTLPRREYHAGMAEVIKYGAICDAEFLSHIEQAADLLLVQDENELAFIVSQSIQYKARIVAADEREAGVRAVLNFGHSFAHALESLTAYERYLHGEAVAIGMVVAATLSEMKGTCQEGISARLASLLQRFDLPTRIPPELDTAALLDCMKLDKKNLSSRKRLILLKAAGDAFVDESCTDQEIAAAIDACR